MIKKTWDIDDDFMNLFNPIKQYLNKLNSLSSGRTSSMTIEEIKVSIPEEAKNLIKSIDNYFSNKKREVKYNDEVFDKYMEVLRYAMNLDIRRFYELNTYNIYAIEYDLRYKIFYEYVYHNNFYEEVYDEKFKNTLITILTSRCITSCYYERFKNKSFRIDVHLRTETIQEFINNISFHPLPKGISGITHNSLYVFINLNALELEQEQTKDLKKAVIYL